MAEYDPRPGASPDQELFQRLRRLEQTVDRLQGVIERGDTWQSWTPVYALISLTQTSYTQYALSYGGYFNQDVLEVHSPFNFVSGGAHTIQFRTGDTLYTLTSPSRSVTGTHRLRWLHPYQTHPEDYRYQPGSSSVLRIAPPSHISLHFQGSGSNSWLAWIPMSRAVSYDILTDATTGGTWTYF